MGRQPVQQQPAQLELFLDSTPLTILHRSAATFLPPCMCPWRLSQAQLTPLHAVDPRDDCKPDLTSAAALAPLTRYHLLCLISSSDLHFGVCNITAVNSHACIQLLPHWAPCGAWHKPAQPMQICVL